MAELAVVLQSAGDGSHLIVLAVGDQRFCNHSVLAQYVVGRARITRVDGGPQIAVEAHHGRFEQRAVRLVGERQMTGTDADQIGHIAQPRDAQPNRNVQLREHLVLEP